MMYTYITEKEKLIIKNQTYFALQKSEIPAETKHCRITGQKHTRS